LNLVFIYADDANSMNCSYFNCIMPAKAINKVPGHVAQTFNINEFNQNGEAIQKACMESDLIVIERNLFGDTLTLINFYKVRGKKVVAIFDDSYNLMCEDNASFSFWRKSEIVQPNAQGVPEVHILNPTPLEQLAWGIRDCLGLICPSRVLADDWNYLNKTWVTENYLDFSRYEGATPLFPHPENELYVGWGGSLSHLSSFEMSGIAGALTYIARKYPHVKLFFSGDRRVYDRINVSEKSKIFSPFVPEEKFSCLIKTLDVGISVLASEYDKRRSRAKNMDYMALKIPWIATDFPPYEGMREYGTLVQNGLGNWKTGLEDMVTNIDAKRELAKGKAYEFALTQTWDRNVGKLLSMYQEIINSKYQ
jgi:hypothetical protein